MKNKLLLSNIRRILTSYKRFISLSCMALLGVGFYVGIKACSPDMLKTIDNYLNDQNVYDVEIISNLGLNDDDVEELKKIDKNYEVEGVKSTDTLIELNDIQKVIRITSLNNINEVILKEGRLPKNTGEIVVEKKLLDESKLKIGDYLTIENSNLTASNYKIVGVVESPLFFSTYKGTSNVGNGELNYYTYVIESNFNTSYYNTIYIDANIKYETNSDKYLEKLESLKKEIKKIKKSREQVRYNELYGETINQMNSLGISVDNLNLTQPTWYIQDITDNQSYSSFIEAADSMKQIGSVFPLVFYVVAILISLVSMTRMVDEDRLEIGTLKGLGFSNIHIASKYIIYSLLACTLGGIIGMVIGFNLLPRIVWEIYKSMFTIPNFVCEFNMYYASIGIIIAIICICGASLITAYTSLKEKPSILMRPKAPKVGKKILLERIHFIWDKIKFSNKITIRNIFRYKKRIFITILGIAGSTALVLVGFGVKDSVSDIVINNYENVFIYDKMINLKNDQNLDSLEILLKDNKNIKSNVKVLYQTLDIYNNDLEKEEVNLIVPEEKDNLTNVIKLNDINNDKKEIKIKRNKVILSEKLAKTLNVEVGDKISFLVNDSYKKIEVSNIVENYIDNYCYLDKETYQEIFGEYSSNVIFLDNKSNYKNNFDKKILENENVSNIVSVKSITRVVNKTLSSLNSVVVVLIVSSAILAFVILYNLSNINISERKREISTLKVLGFYDEEIDAYITKENYFITIVGISIGLVLGLYLSYYVISTCEPQNLMFIRHIKPASYIISILISFVFTIIINILTHYNLKKIDMVSSLKNNE